jgi:iron complex outermembrane receptor protein
MKKISAVCICFCLIVAPLGAENVLSEKDLTVTEEVTPETLSAEEESAKKKLFYDPIVISATRLPSVKTRLSDSPSNISVVTRADFKGTGAQTVQQGLQYVEGINLYDAVGNGVDASLNVRGFTNNEELAVIIDGVRVNETDLNAFNPNLIYLETIESMELVRGSSSTLYGDSVFGGVLNITTAQPSEKPFSSFGMYEGGSYRKQNYMGGASGTVEDKYILGVPGRVKYYFSGARRLDGGYRENGDTRGTWFDGKLGYQLEDETGEVMLNIKYTDQENHNPGELTLAEYSADRRQSVKPLDNRKWENLILSLNANKTFFDEHLDFSVNTYRRLNDIDFTSSYRSGTTEEFFQYSTQKGIVSQVAYNETLGEFKNQLIGGVEYSNASDNNEKIVLAGAGSTSDNSLDKDNTGFFMQDTLTVYEKLILHFGMRHDEVDFRFDDHSNGANNAVSGFDETTVKTGVVIKPIDMLDIYGNFSQAFKAPGSSELFNTTGWGGNDPGLKPEEAVSFEAGTRLRWNEYVSFKNSYFHIDTEEEIQSIETAPWTYVNQNIGKTRRYGIESSVTVKPNDLCDAYFTYTYTDATVRKTTTYVESGRELGLVPRNRFTAGIHLGPVKGCQLWLNALYVGRQQSQAYETLSFSTSPIESYFVLNGKVSYDYKGAEIYFLVNNILDREYYTRAIYDFTGTTTYVTPAPERELMAGVRFQF